MRFDLSGGGMSAGLFMASPGRCATCFPRPSTRRSWRRGDLHGRGWQQRDLSARGQLPDPTRSGDDVRQRHARRQVFLGPGGAGFDVRLDASPALRGYVHAAAGWDLSRSAPEPVEPWAETDVLLLDDPPSLDAVNMAVVHARLSGARVRAVVAAFDPLQLTAPLSDGDLGGFIGGSGARSTGSRAATGRRRTSERSPPAPPTSSPARLRSSTGARSPGTAPSASSSPAAATRSCSGTRPGTRRRSTPAPMATGAGT